MSGEPRTWTLEGDGFTESIHGPGIAQPGDPLTRVEVVERSAFVALAEERDALVAVVAEVTAEGKHDPIGAIRRFASDFHKLEMNIFRYLNRAESAEAEVVRLREALDRISDIASQQGRHPDGDGAPLAECGEIADAALSASPVPREGGE